MLYLTFPNRASAAIKSQATIESQFIEAQTALEEETKQKLALSSKLRQLEADKEALRDQLEEEEEAKRNYEKQIGVLTQQLTDAKKKAEDEAEQASILEESKKKLAKDLEALQRQVEELTAANDKLEKSKKKIAAELEDANIDLETQRSKVNVFLSRLGSSVHRVTPIKNLGCRIRKKTKELRQNPGRGEGDRRA